MINSSGVGTYLKNLLPLIIGNSSNIKFLLIGNETELSDTKLFNFTNVDILPIDISIYSIKEQIILPFMIPKKTDLYWSPHYNIPILFKGKLLVTIHDLYYLSILQSGFNWIKSRYARYFLNLILKRANKIISVSKFTKNEYIKYFGHENNYKKIIPIHNGIEKKNILNDNNPLNKPYLLTVGNVKPNKNLSRLVDAFNKIMDKIPNELVLVGKKSGFISGDEEVIKKVNSFGQRIRMTGFVDDNELQNYYQHAEAFIFPSIYEGFGFPPLEAMATGTPVIASNAASIPEVCGDAALYFNPYDINDMANKIFQMVKNNDMKKEYINKGINQVKKYSWEKTAKKTCDVIMEILKDN